VTSTRARLPAAERRAALLETALRVFGAGSYRGVTTADIAREAGVTEPILYRHFSSKRDLYLACFDEAWERMRAVWEGIVGTQPPAEWFHLMARSFLESRHGDVPLANLWIQTLAEAGDDDEIRAHLRRHLRAVHDFLADAIVRAQAAGAVLPERDPVAEAWVFMSLGLLGSIGRRLGGLAEKDFPRIRAARREWMLGEAPGPA
jgi:AcrR family transcriptional regulator